MEIIHERAQLRLIDSDDVETLFSIVEGNRDIWAYLISKMDSVQDMQQYVQKAIKSYGRGNEIPFVVVDQQTNTIVGSTRLYNISVEDKTVELGQTWYHPSVQRTSINTECKYMLLQYAFEKLHMLRVQIKTDARNEKAQRAIERLGAVKEGMLRNERKLPSGHVRDAVVYSIIVSEWPIVKARLLEKLELYKENL
ncbi:MULTISPECIES: GNAT family N-acetyltransferase [Bacillus]|uniref:N-acetyltransferase n=2 Tax=Bacillus cereus group TaxID=86661 RepID=A0A2A7D7K8_BACAN|nr:MULTISPECIES: GNAT family protein [Bacillus]MCP1164234.1 GNAT family N-acetyltransferase [Bacillus sp. 1813sda1]MDC7974851.1 GNAT family protein [Bacillus sp. BLCC-B18]OTW71978.1 GNAT family N-acetyltransferase [Bacillus thuringiensis serovar coreanensis]OTX55597.1 GNAT family N-acetyltransferase [Bacillus thuringiensis serovar sooncheon]OTX58935.1 GNAT family N-acetyltransferase [Bacillus thuringiensis serovar guiyangiensis]